MIILQVDERSFLFQSEKNSGVARPTGNFTLSEFDNFKILHPPPQPRPDAGGEVELEMSRYPAGSPAWYPYASLAITDPGVGAFLQQRRRPADTKFLALPFIKQFALTDGKK